MTTDALDGHVALAIRLADEAGKIARHYFRSAVVIQTKADGSPVTKADREIEGALRAILKSAVPDHGILGEEEGGDALDAEYVWVIDPIDGTKSFVAGRPTFGVLIALTRHGLPVLGIIDQPITRERWIGVDGRPTSFNGVPVRVAPERPLDEAVCFTAAPEMFDDDIAENYRAVRAVARWVCYNGDCYAYGLLALGQIDAVFERFLSPHDYCALVPIVRNAGGNICDWQGAPLSLTSDGTVIAATGPRLGETIATMLRRKPGG